MKRSCAYCLHENLISNTELEFRYGLFFSDFIEEYSCKGGLILPPECFKNHTAITPALEIIKSANWLDSKKIQHTADVYMWKPHMEELLGVDFAKSEAEQMKRKAAAQFLTSRIVRLSDAIQVQKQHKNAASQSILEKVNRKKWHNMLRKCSPMKPDKIWIAGGATYACLKRGKLWWRPGFNPTRSRKIYQIALSALKSAVRLGPLPARPPNLRCSIVSVNSIYMV
jgi:hypothetical protein